VLGKGLEPRDVRRAVHTDDLLPARVSTRKRGNQRPVGSELPDGVGHAGVHGFEPGRSLRVTPARVVISEERVFPDEQHGFSPAHGTRRRVCAGTPAAPFARPTVTLGRAMSQLPGLRRRPVP
jgi:hypothetical protein